MRGNAATGRTILCVRARGVQWLPAMPTRVTLISRRYGLASPLRQQSIQSINLGAQSLDFSFLINGLLLFAPL
jgi:hypothetical protein